ncbi:CopK family periplasmic copper-binding protein [Rhodoferax sp. BAB1]|uniref:CopK family periplasmic copper-binding protein n=1 Tax=Rhodoferax sp. BAB1 TaxID=2741720 RepID=UPI001574EE81|nr:CopK family periplasmic copper-binding protein [Rhodoferax sp. BAB1]QKO23395.1 CopK family periplasmic copper-binding protein [Rhodoferax sp. BAB1]
MNSRITSLFAAVVLSTLASGAFASDSLANNVDKTYRLKDGGTVFVFKDGKLAMADKFDRAIHVSKGQVVETADGQKISMTSSESARLDFLQRQGHEN